MSKFLDPAKFYRASLELQGRPAVDEEAELSKVAAATSRPIHIVKLAQAYYEQLQKDEVVAVAAGGDPWYDDPAKRSEDAFKLAEGFFDSAAQMEASWASAVTDLVKETAKVAAAWAAEQGLTVADALKIAAMELSTVTELFTRDDAPPEDKGEDKKPEEKGEEKSEDKKPEEKGEEKSEDKKPEEKGEEKSEDEKPEEKGEEKSEDKKPDEKFAAYRPSDAAIRAYISAIFPEA